MSIVPYAMQSDLVVYPLSVQYEIVYHCWSQTPTPLLTDPFPLSNHKSVLCVCKFVSVSQVSSLVSYFRLHM